MFRTETSRTRTAVTMIVLLVFFTFPSPFALPFSHLTAEAHQEAAMLAKVDRELKEYQQMRILLAHDATNILGLPQRKSRVFGGLSAKQADAVMEIHKAFGRKHFKNAVRIAYCESRLDPSAINRANRNRTVDRGLFQLNSGGTMQRLGVSAREAFNPAINARAARVLFEDRGWQPWSCQYVYKILNKYKAKEAAAAKAAKQKPKASKTDKVEDKAQKAKATKAKKSKKPKKPKKPKKSKAGSDKVKAANGSTRTTR